MSRLQTVLIRTSLALALLTAVEARFPAGAQTPAQPRVIDVVVKRYAFDPAEIRVTEGETVRLMVRSADGLHGVQVKPLNIKKEVPRGTKPTVIEFTAPKAGRYPVLCSEFCGDGHADMQGALVVTAKGSDSD